ncbi:MAG: hypothetical protein WKF89_00330 [Chitinophagaceae bacterium]
MKKLPYFCLTIAVFIVTIVLPACSNQISQGKTVTRKSAYPAVIEQAKKDKRYFIMYSGVNIYSITNVEIDKGKQQMTVQLDKVDSLHQAYVTNNQTMRYKPREEEPASLSEILVYMSDSTSYTLDEPHTILLNKVAKIDLID